MQRAVRMARHEAGAAGNFLADAASRSTWESRLRVCYIIEAKLPRPLVNVPIFDRSGRLLGIADLFDVDAGFVVEFDGQHHRGRRQHRDDNVREESFESAGLVVARADSLDLMRHRRELVRRLRDGHARGVRRDRRQDRWTLVEPDWWLATRTDGLLTDSDKDELFGRYDA